MNGSPVDEAVRARIERVLREDTELTAAEVAGRFGVSRTAVNRLRRELGLKRTSVRMYPKDQADRRFRFPRMGGR